MNSKLRLSCVCMILAFGLMATAGDISGKWYIPSDGVDIEMVVKIDGSTLTGTMNNPLSGETKIKDGKIEGNNISFYIVRKLGQREMRIAWTGYVTGDEIEFVRAIPGARPMKTIAKRTRSVPPAAKTPESGKQSV